MSDINTLLDDSNSSSVTYYDESMDTPKAYMGEGEYPAHITKVETAERMVKGKYKAKIYNCTVTLADDCANRKYICPTADGKTVETNGSDFVGRTIRSQGVFQFLHPAPTDTYEANPGGNKNYLNFCDAIGVECPVKEVDIDGQKKKVKELPNLTEDAILGKPILATIKKGKPWTGKDGKTRNPLEVKWFTEWKEGKPISVDLIGKDDEDIPF